MQAARFLDEKAKDKDLEPNEKWDGSIISLLNYPKVLEMMSDDLDWTQQLGRRPSTSRKISWSPSSSSGTRRLRKTF